MNESIARLLLRLVVGGMLLLHGIHKALHGIGFINSLLKAHGLPEILAYGVYVGEILAPIFLIIGWKSRVWASVIAFNMLTAIYLTHKADLFTLGAQGGWSIELPILYLIGAVSIILLGSGKYAIMRD